MTVTPPEPAGAGLPSRSSSCTVIVAVGWQPSYGAKVWPSVVKTRLGACVWNAPISRLPPTVRGRPRWSVAGRFAAAALPAAMAGLPAKRARVCVGPP